MSDVTNANATTATILVTDDERNIRLLLRAALDTEGYAVVEAADGRAALEAIDRDRPDLMLLDLNMPVMDGMAVLAALRDRPARGRPRVIVLTAYGSIAAAVRATRLGAADFLEKPVSPDDLRAAVRGLLAAAEPDGSDAAAPGEAVAVPHVADVPGGYEAVLDQARRSLRLMDLTDAEALLMRAAEVRERHSAAYFNLLGLLYESQHHGRLARRCYGKALDADAGYAPAQTNFRRLDELARQGHSDRRVVLGDEPADGWLAQLPPAKAAAGPA